MKYSLSFLLVMILLITISCKNKINTPFITTIPVYTADSLRAVDKEIILIDVRTPEEHAEGAIPNSGNVDVRAADFRSQITAFDTLDTYLIYCRSGSRSATAVEIMEELGFKHLYNLDGGYLAWSEQNGQ